MPDPRLLTVSAHGVTQTFGVPPGDPEAAVREISAFLAGLDAADWTHDGVTVHGIVRSAETVSDAAGERRIVHVDEAATQSVIRAAYGLPCPHEFGTGEPDNCSWCGEDR